VGVVSVSLGLLALMAILLLAALVPLAVGLWGRRRARRMPPDPVVDASDLDNGALIAYLQQEEKQ
jgi:hypothetical protein